MNDFPYQLMDTTIYAVPTPPDYRKILQGSNQKQILIVFVGEEGTEYSAKEAFLTKIFAAVAIDLKADTHFIGVNASLAKTVSYSGLVNLGVYQKVFFFGYQTSEIGLRINTPAYTACQLNKQDIFFADDLSILETDKPKKLALWNYLQKAFPKP